MSAPRRSKAAASFSAGWCRRAGLLAVVVVTASGSARAQSREGGDFGASSQSVKQGALQPFSGPQNALPLPHMSPAPIPSAGADPTSPAALMPSPSSYLSSVWTLWPHAWAYVPSLWSAWYADLVLQSKPAQAEPAETGSPSVTIVDSHEGGTAPHIVIPPKPGLVDPDSQGLPPPRLIGRRRYNLVISGAGLLVATWAADRLLANGLSNSPQTWLPLVGPWFLLGEQSALASPSPQIQALLIIDGLLQAGGLSMALLGFVLTTKRYVVIVKPRSGDLAPQEAP